MSASSDTHDAAGSITSLGDRGALVSARLGRLRGLVWAVFGLSVAVFLGAVAFALASLTPATVTRWSTLGVLLVLVVGVSVLSSHAGHHALLLPIPALALAVVFVLVAGHHRAAASWWLVALSAAFAGAGVMLGATALAQQVAIPPETRSDVEGRSGVALTDLSPLGVVKVRGVRWGAESLSGPLSAGTPIHVARAEGIRLRVWSEAGTVPTLADRDANKETGRNAGRNAGRDAGRNADGDAYREGTQ